MKLRRHYQRAWLSDRASDCSVSAIFDSLTTSGSENLQATQRPGYQSAYPDSSGQEQGGVGGSVATRRQCAGQRQPQVF
jgi:hypothetical protein